MKWAACALVFSISIAASPKPDFPDQGNGNAFGHRNRTPTATAPPPSPTATSTATLTPAPTTTTTPTATATVTTTATPLPNCSGSLQSLIDAAPAGSVVRLPACVYRETITITKPLTLDGQKQAEIRGTDQWTSWTSSGSVWLSGQSYPNVGDDSTAGVAPCEQSGPCYIVYFRAFNLEQVFFDGVPQLHVASAPTAGQFALDASRRVVVGSNPSGRLVEVTARKRWVNTQADSVTLTNLAFHHAATGAFESAVSSDLHKGFVLSSSTLTDAHGSMAGSGGEGPGGGAHYLNNTLVNAGDAALSGYQGDGVVIQGNTFLHNGYGGWEPNWQAGAVKVVAMTNVLIDSNTVRDTFGHGLWCDIHCNGATFSNNRVSDTNESALFFEISNHARITNNVVWNTGTRGGAASVSVSNSGNVEVDHNVVYNTAGPALWVFYANRPDTDVFLNNDVHDNTVIQLHDGWPPSLGFGDYGTNIATNPASNIRGANNRFGYPTPESANERFWWGALHTGSLAAFNATPGGGGNSRYLTDAEKGAVLAAAGIP